MEVVAKRGMAEYPQYRQHVVPGTVAEYMPKWYNEAPKQVKDLKTHAHWVAAYWSRALAQLAAQGHAGRGTVSMSDLLTQCLTANQVAVENSCRLGWEYDGEMWADLADRVRRREEVNVSEEFRREIQEHFLQRIKRQVLPEQPSQAGSSSSSGGKGTKSAKAPVPQYQQYGPTQGKKGSGKKAGKSKGTGKAQSKNKWSKVKEEGKGSKSSDASQHN